jgi:predicted RNA-binding Zn ribbon-like protein
MGIATTITEMHLDGGAACLDFVNSALNTEKEEIVERLNTYDDLLILSSRLFLIDNQNIKLLREKAKNNPGEANEILSVARQVRLRLDEVFRTMAHGQLDKIEPMKLEKLNQDFAETLNNRKLVVTSGQLQMRWLTNENIDLKLPLWTFILSAYELLLHEEKQYIRQCAACRWLFLDTSKSHRRKWCDMQTCGSSEKSRRYYKKRKSQDSK